MTTEKTCETLWFSLIDCEGFIVVNIVVYPHKYIKMSSENTDPSNGTHVDRIQGSMHI
jgi:hypothetical protein